jgi:hypothetical protein
MQLNAKPTKNGSLGMLPGRVAMWFSLRYHPRGLIGVAMRFNLRYHHPHGLIGVTMLPDPIFLLRNHPQGLRIVALMLTGNLLPPALLLCHLPRRTTPTTAKISIPLGETTIMVDQGVRGETILGLGLGFGPLDLPPFLTTPTSRIYLLVPMIQDTTVDMTVVHRLVQTMPETEPTMTVTEPTMTKATTEATTEVIRYTLIGLRMSMLTKGRPLDPGEVVQNWITMVATHKTMSPC